MAINNYYAVIMAGGIGTRFWPLSTESNPKQFQDILGNGSSMLQDTFKRLSPVVAPSKMIIATNKQYALIVKNQLPKIATSQIFCEPTMRNTAPCILVSALKIVKQHPNAIMVVAPSDHWIENNNLFLKNILTGLEYSENKDTLLTLGITPNHPNTGYGYIKYDKNDKNFIKSVSQFTEKPNLEKATHFVSAGNYLWNAGIFIWKASSIIEAFQKYLPDMYGLLSEGENYWNTEKENAFLEKNYPLCENISIDFGILEKAKNVAVLPSDFNWFDLGTWCSLYEKKGKDRTKNVSIGTTVYYKNANRNIIHNSNPDKKIVVQGLDDFIVVDKENVLMICPKNKEQNIKKIIEEAKDFFGKDEFNKL